MLGRFGTKITEVNTIDSIEIFATVSIAIESLFVLNGVCNLCLIQGLNIWILTFLLNNRRVRILIFFKYKKVVYRIYRKKLNRSLNHLKNLIPVTLQCF